jgi:CubicO group peptidase (beta-lactamase class C family)
MESAIPQGQLGAIVREAWSRTGVPAIAAGLSVDGSVELVAAGHCTAATPFRVASVSKWFTASLVSACGVLDDETRRWLSHTAGLRSEVAAPLPAVCQGLWSYANSGFWAAGERCAAAAGMSFADAMRARIIEPLGLGATAYEEPQAAAEDHTQEGETGHRPAGHPDYPVARYPSGGLWSTVGDLVRFAEHQLDDPYGLQTPQIEALGAEYCLGCWRRELEGGRIAFDHEGSIAGFQSLLLIVPAERVALAVLTNSWRGSGAIRRVVARLGLTPPRGSLSLRGSAVPEPGRYGLDDAEALVERRGDGWRITEAESDPVSGLRIEQPPYPVEPLVGDVYGLAGGLLMSHRVDFPRPGVARVGWVALPRVDDR